jgi:hypothetical protein
MVIRESSPRKPLVRRKRHDKGYSCEDIWFPQIKELRVVVFPYYKINSLLMKHQRLEEVFPEENIS